MRLHDMRAAAALILLIAVSAGPALAAPGPLVEEISPPRAGLVPMSYLAVGQTFELGAGQRLVLSYPERCIREIIVGGRVSIGAEHSAVSGGTVRRETVECDGGRLSNSAAPASGAGAYVVRSMSRKPPPP